MGRASNCASFVEHGGAQLIELSARSPGEDVLASMTLVLDRIAKAMSTPSATTSTQPLLQSANLARFAMDSVRQATHMPDQVNITLTS